MNLVSQLLIKASKMTSYKYQQTSLMIYRSDYSNLKSRSRKRKSRRSRSNWTVFVIDQITTSRKQKMRESSEREEEVETHMVVAVTKQKEKVRSKKGEEENQRKVIKALNMTQISIRKSQSQFMSLVCLRCTSKSRLRCRSQKQYKSKYNLNKKDWQLR